MDGGYRAYPGRSYRVELHLSQYYPAFHHPSLLSIVMFRISFVCVCVRSFALHVGCQSR